MALTKAKIYELQDHFDGRSKLQKVAFALKNRTNNASIFYSYTDGYGKKQYVNIPIEPDEILPIIERYIENIEKDIIEITSPEVIIVNEAQIIDSVEDYKTRYPDTYTSLEKLKERLKQSYLSRKEDVGGQFSVDDGYHIEVCSDWQDKIYVLELVSQDDDSIMFEFKEIFKL